MMLKTQIVIERKSTKLVYKWNEMMHDELH